jgi:hypothetical protein
MSNFQEQAIASITETTPVIAANVYRNADFLRTLKTKKQIKEWAASTGYEITSKSVKVLQQFLLRACVNYSMLD